MNRTRPFAPDVSPVEVVDVVEGGGLSKAHPRLPDVLTAVYGLHVLHRVLKETQRYHFMLLPGNYRTYPCKTTNELTDVFFSSTDYKEMFYLSNSTTQDAKSMGSPPAWAGTWARE